jgi:hypothetical protein
MDPITPENLSFNVPGAHSQTAIFFYSLIKMKKFLVKRLQFFNLSFLIKGLHL